MGKPKSGMNDSPLDIEKMKKLYDSLDDKQAFIDNTGLTRSALLETLKGNTSPTIRTIQAFASFFNMRCAELFKDNKPYSYDGKPFSKCLELKDCVVLYND